MLVVFEVWGELELEGLNFMIGGKVDCIDMMFDGQVILYDYKFGLLFMKKQQFYFDKQLLFEVVMVV